MAEVSRSERLDAARECDLALDRLLDEERRRAQLLQRRLGFHRAPQLDDRFDVLVLLVAVEGDVQRPGDAVDEALPLLQKSIKKYPDDKRPDEDKDKKQQGG